MAARQNQPRRKSVKGHSGVYYRIDKDGKRAYEVMYRDSAGTQHWSRVNGGLEDADKALRAIKTRLDQGQRMVPTTRPFEELAWEWFDREKDRLKPSTRRIYETGLRLHVLP